LPHNERTGGSVERASNGEVGEVGFREVGFQDELAAAAERVESEQGPPSREVMEKDQRE
jgi:hypothetical protein